MLIGIDFETRGLKPDGLTLDEWILGYGVAPENEPSYSLKWDENAEQTLGMLAAEHTLVFYNAPFELTVFKLLGIPVPNFEDAAQACYVLFPDVPLTKDGSKHSLKSWAERLGLPAKGDPGTKDWRNAVWDAKMASYCELDASLGLKIYAEATRILKNDKKAYQFYQNVARPFCRSVVELETNGLHFGREELTAFIQEKQSKCDELIAKMRELVPRAPGDTVKYNSEKEEGDKLLFVESKLVPDTRKTAEPGSERMQYVYKKWGEFNPGSAHQIAWALSELYNWQPEEFTDGGTPSTSTDVLESINNPLAKLLVEYSENNKLITSFGQSILDKMDENGYIYPSVNNTGTVTGRLSMNNPNLQNLPHSPEYRACITAPKGRKLVGCDMGGFQIKILAYLLFVIAKVSALLDKMNEGIDAHTATAQLINVVRRIGKTINFSIAFGAGAKKVAVSIGDDCDTEQAATYLELVGEFLGVTKLKHILWTLASAAGGVIHDLMGRRLVYPDINSDNKQKRASAERRVFNALIQSTEASVMQHLTERIRLQLLNEKLDAKIVVQVHDELIVDALESDAERVAAIMTEAFSDKRYLPALTFGTNEAKIGNNWQQIH